jgi:predicted amidohydrolase
MEPAIGNLDANLEQLKVFLEEASEKEIDVLVLPELANSGYVFESLEEARNLSEVIPAGPYSKVLLDWSAKGRLVVAGICERNEEGLYNSAAAFANGNHLVTYRKIHLFSNEFDWFQQGREEPPVIEHKGTRFGLMICFDWVFPEMARILALKGAQMILHPANLVLPYCQDAMITRSIENRIFTATANRVGTERNLTFSGLSQITSPKGEVLLRMGTTDTGINWVDLDSTVADDKKLTKRNDVLLDRKPGLYHRITEGA